MTPEQKQILRQRRERRLRVWLTTLSWTVPIVAFTGFFSIWKQITSAITPDGNKNAASGYSTATDQSSGTVVSAASKPNTSTQGNHALLKLGAQGPQVSMIQEELKELGYFNHAITEHYGLVTAQAVSAFQMAEHLPVTGEVDTVTLNALQQALRQHRTSVLVNGDVQGTSNDSNAPSHSSGSTISRFSGTNHVPSQSTPAGQNGNTGAVTVSQQPIPQTRSSASGR